MQVLTNTDDTFSKKMYVSTKDKFVSTIARE